ncbi:hypothetical protein GUJ93_ZPchr0012g22075 [Zizania palustris]|uniref:Uncharacterized protein n=1 Tax=Zizania palustris TaxID=103762 RepID=A0A8J6BPI6_ZIZPA|nr:hypothetical protein GUJ93_ZPchr0012g22075 [Zizania palustris]
MKAARVPGRLVRAYSHVLGRGTGPFAGRRAPGAGSRDCCEDSPWHGQRAPFLFLGLSASAPHASPHVDLPVQVQERLPMLGFSVFVVQPSRA